MPYHEHDFADVLFAWPAAEGRIIHLYELDPTHVAAQPSHGAVTRSRIGLAEQPSRSAPLYCARSDVAPAAVLLELDPTHSHSD